MIIFDQVHVFIVLLRHVRKASQVEAFGKAEFSVELPEEVLDHLMRVLDGPARLTNLILRKQTAFESF